jgi:hypothetical protein
VEEEDQQQGKKKEKKARREMLDIPGYSDPDIVGDLPRATLFLCNQQFTSAQPPSTSKVRKGEPHVPRAQP